MMGERQVAQEALFYEFSLERHVPADHWVRAIDRFVDLSEIRAHLRPFYSEMGRPSVDPELMIRMLLVGYCFGIRSERRLCEEVHLNLAYRWFCRLGLEGAVPDHSTFSKNRHGRFREPICKVLPIAPSTYHDHVAKRADPEKLSARMKRDAGLKPEIERIFAQNFGVYGVRKVWRQMLREGFTIARCTVERLMGDLGLHGVIRGKPLRTTVQDRATLARWTV